MAYERLALLTDIIVKGVKVAGTLLTPDSDGIVNVPIASNATNGVVNGSGYRGISISSTGQVNINTATYNGINNRTGIGNSGYGAITTDNYDKAVKQAMTDGLGTAWTDLEKKAARTRMGAIGGVYELIETINITEDTQTITRTQTPQSVNYNFSRLQVVVTAPSVTSSSWITIQPHINGTNINNFVEVSSAFHTSLQGSVQFHVGKEYGFITGYALKNIQYNPTSYYGAYGEMLNLYTGNITGFTISLGESMCLSSGAVVKIYAIAN